MANIIAVVWDFDKTLVDGYMQDPIFAHFNVDAEAFWREVDALPDKYKREQHVRVNRDTIYLNHFIRYAKEGKFPGLNNQMLRQFGSKLTFYPGVPDIFEAARNVVAGEKRYTEYDIKVEHYVVSTGMREIIRGSIVENEVECAWGCELIEDTDPNDGNRRIISEIGYSIDNTSKTRALFEINKGVPQRDSMEVNTKVPEAQRRVRFENMIYIADGPSDIPAFSLTHKNGGATFAVYPHADFRAFRQVEQLRQEGRIDMFAEADYREGTTAYMWITQKIREYAERICRREQAKIPQGGTPKHL